MQVQSSRRELLPGGSSSFIGSQLSFNLVCAVTKLLAKSMCLPASAFMHADTGDGHLAVCADCAEACMDGQDRSQATRASKGCLQG